MALPSTAVKAALIIVDLQEDFCAPNGSLAIAGGRDIAPNINTLLDLPFALKIATRDFHPADHVSFVTSHEGAVPFQSSVTIANPENVYETQSTALWPPHCVQDTPGCELIPELDQSKIDLMIDKGMDKRVESYSAFGPPFKDPPISKSGLEAALKEAGITQVFVAGLAFDVCVAHTAADAAELGFETFIVHDATATVRDTIEDSDAVANWMEHVGVEIFTDMHMDIWPLNKLQVPTNDQSAGDS